MPCICVSQFLQMFRAPDDQIIGKVVIVMDGENDLRQPHLANAPRNDDGVVSNVRFTATSVLKSSSHFKSSACRLMASCGLVKLSP